MKKLQEFERRIRSVYYDAQIYWKYGTYSPEAVTLPTTDVEIYLDSHDYRARKMIITNCCVRGRIPRNQRFWRTAVEVLQPETALDVGLNYGECMLSMRYPAETKLIAFEANLKLKEHIEKTIEAHPNREQIACVYQLATDKVEETDFYINENWSGSSSAAPPDVAQTSDKFEKVTVTSTTVDQVISESGGAGESLFFKIDVEGYEYRVLLGMQNVLQQTQEAVGFIEFDPMLLRRAGEDVEQFWNYLLKEFRLYAFDQGQQLQDFQDYSFSDLEFLCGKSFHTDLLLVKSPRADERLRQIVQAWEQPASLKRAA